MIKIHQQKMSTSFNTISTVDIVLTFSVDIILSSVNIFNNSDHSLEFVQYLEFAFDYIHCGYNDYNIKYK